MTDRPRVNWREWREGKVWLSESDVPDEPLELPMGEDASSFFLTEAQWAKVRYAIQYYAQAVEDQDLTNELVEYDGITDLLAPENWADFRLSRDRAVGLKPGTIAHPGPTSCCTERMIKPSQGARWRCYGCGRML